VDGLVSGLDFLKKIYLILKKSNIKSSEIIRVRSRGRWRAEPELLVLLNKDMAGKLEHRASEKADKTSKEADRVSAETRRLASKEAGRDGWGRGR
jgi:hypothetical protein